ncbi:MAG: hypothetical protein JKY62_16690 [Desulfocapsa sp.]|nr:hypothetical protein [Desulfocapsa sp.]
MITLGKLKYLLGKVTELEGITDDCAVDVNVYHQIEILKERMEWNTLAKIDLDDGEITKC